MNLSVVPEFSTLTTSSGTIGRVPLTVRTPSRLSIMAPMAAQASTVALVSRERSGLRILDPLPRLPAWARLAIITALCV
jgi:hypothetical protein